MQQQVVWRKQLKNIFQELQTCWLPDGLKGTGLKTDLYDEATYSDWVLGPFVPQNTPCIGIDLSFNTAQAAQRRMKTRNVTEHRVVLNDVRCLSFHSQFFNYVLSHSSIDHFENKGDISLAIGEMYRVLKPGGQISVSTFDKLFYKEWNWFYEIAKTYLPSEHEETQETETDNEPEPVFDTPEGLKAIMNAACFDDIRIFSETAEFVYETEEEFWSTLWSHGARGTLEQIEQETGSDGLQMFKFDVFKKMSEIKKTDGLHQLVPVHVGLATKPKD